MVGAAGASGVGSGIGGSTATGRVNNNSGAPVVIGGVGGGGGAAGPAAVPAVKAAPAGQRLAKQGGAARYGNNGATGVSSAGEKQRSYGGAGEVPAGQTRQPAATRQRCRWCQWPGRPRVWRIEQQQWCRRGQWSPAGPKHHRGRQRSQQRRHGSRVGQVVPAAPPAATGSSGDSGTSSASGARWLPVGPPAAVWRRYRCRWYRWGPAVRAGPEVRAPGGTRGAGGVGGTSGVSRPAVRSPRPAPTTLPVASAGRQGRR